MLALCYSNSPLRLCLGIVGSLSWDNMYLFEMFTVDKGERENFNLCNFIVYVCYRNMTIPLCYIAFRLASFPGSRTRAWERCYFPLRIVWNLLEICLFWDNWRGRLSVANLTWKKQLADVLTECSSHRQGKSEEVWTIFIAVHYWGYTSCLRSRGLFLPICTYSN